MGVIYFLKGQNVKQMKTSKLLKETDIITVFINEQEYNV